MKGITFDTKANFCIMYPAMSNKVRVLSPAKVNLHLEVYPKREDGFHALLSVFQMISLYDEMEIRSLTNKDVCTIDGNFDFPAEDNIIWKTCQIFRRETGIRNGAGFTVLKRIPQGAGLGGGSSNAAAALRAMNALFRAGLTGEMLAVMGAEAGSDVPFFCREPAALVTGRGEIIEKLPPRSDYVLVLVIPSVRISTRTAYSWLDDAGAAANPDESRGRDIARKYTGESPENWGFSNSFYSVLRGKEPVFDEIRRDLLNRGAVYANVSGSGSAMFGVFLDKNKALSVRDVMAARYPAVEIAFPLDRIPEAVLQ